MSSLPTSSFSEWGSLRPGASVNVGSPRTRPSAVAVSQGPRPDVEATLAVSRYRDGASLTALAAFTLRGRAGVSAFGRPRDVVANDHVSFVPSDSASVRPGEHPSGIVERSSFIDVHARSPSRPSSA